MSDADARWPTHWDAGHNWVLVLAAGEGSRLQALTTTSSGVAVPKQYCSLRGGPSLLHDALRRAQAVAPPERTCAIVASQHHRWWRSLPQSIPASNIIVQPRNRGTANGILLPLLHIVHRDPDASILVLPSDHYVRRETVLAGSLREAMEQVAACGQRMVMLGLTPQDADPELGYIVPGGDVGPGVRDVQQFIEKPDAATARRIIGRGGLWNAFIFAVRGQSLLEVFEAHCPEIVMEMRGFITHPDETTRTAGLVELYERLPSLDFSRDILERCATQARVITVPPCGWSDLGTPRRVAEALKEGRPTQQPSAAARHAMGILDLAAQHALTAGRLAFESYGSSAQVI